MNDRTDEVTERHNEPTAKQPSEQETTVQPNRRSGQQGRDLWLIHG